MVPQNPDKRIVISDQTESPRLQVLVDYWNGLRGANPWPQWEQVDLMDLYRIAPFMTVKDVIDGGQSFYNRYFGSGLARLVGFDGGHKRAEALYGGENFEIIMRAYRLTVQECVPVQSFGSVFWAENKEHIRYQLIYVPLGGRAGPGVQHLISVLDFDRPRANAENAKDPITLT